MPTENPLFNGKWDYNKFNATVINDIWPGVAFFTLIAAVVTAVSEKTSVQLSVETHLLTVLGVSLGLVISFRTSTAYERYQDGRKMWTNISLASRNMAQMIWIHVPSEREVKDDQSETTYLQHVIEKKTMINLVQAFPVALKHYLRGEAGIYYRDLYPLVCSLPRYVSPAAPHNVEELLLPLWCAFERQPHHQGLRNPVSPANRNPRDTGGDVPRTKSLPVPDAHHTDIHSTTETVTNKSWFSSLGKVQRAQKARLRLDPESALADIPSFRPLQPSRLPPKSKVRDYIPILRFFRWFFLFKWLSRRAKPKAEVDNNVKSKILKKPRPAHSNIPLEILLQLSTYSAWLMKNGLIHNAIATAMTNQLVAMQDTFSNLDRILTTPLPFAYQAHLRMSLWFYLLFLPFQIWKYFHWVTIPATAFTSFLLLGFLEIGQEIENPFNYDANDLDLDSFCLSIQRELHEITAHTAPGPQDFAYSAFNQPFAPVDRRTAEQLCKDGAKSYTVPDQNTDEKDEEPSETDSSQSIKDSLRLTLLRNWNRVDYLTREAH